MTTQNYLPGECRECDGYRYHLETCSQHREELASAYALRRSLTATADDGRASLDDLDGVFKAVRSVGGSIESESGEGYAKTWQRELLVNGTAGLALAFTDRNNHIHRIPEEGSDAIPRECLVIVTDAEYRALFLANLKAEQIEAALPVREGSAA